jgi:hypothetical protein
LRVLRRVNPVPPGSAPTFSASTPFWVGEENKGELRRVGFEALTRVDRNDFGVSWQDQLPGGGVVVSNEIELIIDAEAILLDDLERTGAIDYYRSIGALSG